MHRHGLRRRRRSELLPQEAKRPPPRRGSGSRLVSCRLCLSICLPVRPLLLAGFTMELSRPSPQGLQCQSLGLATLPTAGSECSSNEKMREKCARHASVVDVELPPTGQGKLQEKCPLSHVEAIHRLDGTSASAYAYGFLEPSPERCSALYRTTGWLNSSPKADWVVLLQSFIFCTGRGVHQVRADDARSEAHPRPEDSTQRFKDAEYLPHPLEGG